MNPLSVPVRFFTQPHRVQLPISERQKITVHCESLVGVQIGGEASLWITHKLPDRRVIKHHTAMLPPTMAIRLRSFIQASYLSPSGPSYNSGMFVGYVSGLSPLGATPSTSFHLFTTVPKSTLPARLYIITYHSYHVTSGIGLGPNLIMGIFDDGLALSILRPDTISTADEGFDLIELKPTH